MNRSAIPVTAGEVSKKWLKGPAGPSVEAAERAAVEAAEPALTVKNGSKVPEFIRQRQENRGTGGNTPVAQETPAAVAVVHTPQNPLPTTEPEPTGRNKEMQDNRTLRALRFNAQQKMRQVGLRNGESVDLAALVADGTILKEEAEALLGSEIDVEIAPEPESVAVTPVAVAPVAVAPVAVEPTPSPAPELVAARAPVAAEPEKKEKFENSEFVGQLLQEKGEWVAELVYKNGAGTERFVAPTQRALLLEIMKGKGYATLKIRADRRRERRGEKPDSWDIFWEEAYKFNQIPKEEYEKWSPKAAELFKDTVQGGHILAFFENHPEYYKTDKNWKTIGEELNTQGIPMTLRNLEMAYYDLMTEGKLDLRPKQEIPSAPTALVDTTSAAAVVTKVEDSTSANTPAVSVSTEPVTAPATQPTLRKRGATSLVPGQSSATPAAAEPEEGKKRGAISLKDARQIPQAELERIVKSQRVFNRVY